MPLVWGKEGALNVAGEAWLDLAERVGGRGRGEWEALDQAEGGKWGGRV